MTEDIFFLPSRYIVINTLDNIRVCPDNCTCAICGAANLFAALQTAHAAHAGVHHATMLQLGGFL